MAESIYGEWIGRSEEARDFATTAAVDRFQAVLDREGPPCRPGDPVPLMAHWLYFLPTARQAELGPDGHPKRGGFLPPVHDLPRRMFAGARYTFVQPLPTGGEITRRSTIVSVKETEGKSGRLVFVTLRNEFSVDGGPVAMIEEQDIVYRGLQGAAAKPASPVAPGEWRRTLVPDATLLFRYSAITFNAHRIHYDLDYVQKEEGYPDLVVHGPLIATLLVDLAERHLGGATMKSFSFRALSPLFAGREMSVNGSPPDADGVVKLWASNNEGGLAMQAEAVVAR
ncbi:FAS1-like dehydratase domain-containing protein [Rhodoligotrophos ferricapiens]|uniref:FAS1-like dehydratase domain-containing protein n=1 Tax=Rhodoligotrophos ferricapiens TaxID=3069264 RepID=UPI00315C6657